METIIKWHNLKEAEPENGKWVLTNHKKILLYKDGKFYGDLDRYGFHCFNGVKYWAYVNYPVFAEK